MMMTKFHVNGTHVVIIMVAIEKKKLIWCMRSEEHQALIWINFIVFLVEEER